MSVMVSIGANLAWMLAHHRRNRGSKVEGGSSGGEGRICHAGVRKGRHGEHKPRLMWVSRACTSWSGTGINIGGTWTRRGGSCAGRGGSCV